MNYIEQIYQFLRELEQHNDREWFRPRKPEFEALRQLWIQDVERLTALLAQDTPELATPNAIKVFRIYRDTRFSRDKAPFKTYFSATLRPRVTGPHSAACYYVQMGVGTGYTESGLYGGIWMPERPELNKLRHAIVDNIEEFNSIIHDPELERLAPGWFSESLKKVPLGWPKDHPQAQLLKLKEFGKFTPCSPQFFTSPGWVQRAAEIMAHFKPLVDFINYSLFEE